MSKKKKFWLKRDALIETSNSSLPGSFEFNLWASEKNEVTLPGKK